jgi:CubicO group peptidase (beta-lactamase class C family)
MAPNCVLPPSASPQPLPVTDSEPVFRYKFDGKNLGLDEDMQRQHATALIVVKDDKIVTQRSAYDRKPEDRLLANSMAKTVVALAIGNALEDRKIKSLNDAAEAYATALAGKLYGQTKIMILLRLASGTQFVEDYSEKDELARFQAGVRDVKAVYSAHYLLEMPKTDRQPEEFRPGRMVHKRSHYMH